MDDSGFVIDSDSFDDFVIETADSFVDVHDLDGRDCHDDGCDYYCFDESSDCYFHVRLLDLEILMPSFVSFVELGNHHAEIPTILQHRYNKRERVNTHFFLSSKNKNTNSSNYSYRPDSYYSLCF